MKLDRRQRQSYRCGAAAAFAMRTAIFAHALTLKLLAALYKCDRAFFIFDIGTQRSDASTPLYSPMSFPKLLARRSSLPW